MALLQEIKKNIISETDFFNGLREDLEKFEETFLYARELAEMMFLKGGEDGFVDFANGLFGRDDLPNTINTYPFGTSTKDIYPEFVGACAGEQKLNDLFKAIKKQLAAYASPNYEGRSRKAVTIFTDKWDPKKFAKYEPGFVRATLQNDVYFNFYLITGYGISRIPFLNDKQIERLKKAYQGQAVDEELSLKDLVREHDLYEMEYRIDSYDSWKPYNNDIDCVYRFDFIHLRYTLEGGVDGNCNGRINEVCAKRFIQAAIELDKVGGLNSNIRPSSYVHRELRFDRMWFSWFDNTGIEDRPEVYDMVNALMEMIITLK